MRIRSFQLDGVNETGYLIVDQDDVPIDELCRFTLFEIHGANNSKKKVAKIILHLMRWVERLDVDLISEVVLRGFSNRERYLSFIRHMESHAQNQGKVVQLHNKNIGAEYFNQRLDIALKYFNYLADVEKSRRQIADPMIATISKNMEGLRIKFKKAVLPVDKYSDVKGLSRAQQKSLFKGLNTPGYFGWNNNTALRNKLIVRLIYETGIRKGELLSLVIENCLTRTSVVERPYIKTSHNVKYDDPRTDVPQEKTRERIIPISNDLAELIEEYKLIRSATPEAKKQPPFLILSSESPHMPLSISGLEKVFERIKSKLPDVDFFGPHRLRHTFFDNLDRTFYELGYDAVLTKKLKNTIGGWSPTSNMSENYEKLSTYEQCVEALSTHYKTLEAL